jgi:polyphosphate kinase 2 PPK2
MAATKRPSKAKKVENGGESERAKLGGKDYERALAKLHGELVKLQLWVIAKGLKVVVVFEGRDGAGKGGVIKAITERVSPRVYRVVALPAPTEREKSQMYVQRYMRHMPAAGEIVIFDRSWYNRAGVERVMEFCTLSRSGSGVREGDGRFRNPADQILARGERGGTNAQARGADRRSAQDLEIVADGFEVVQPLVRLFPRPRRHVQGHRYVVGALACGAVRRQETCAAQCDLASLVADSVQGDAAQKARPAEAPEAA